MIGQQADGESKIGNIVLLVVSCLVGILISVSLAHLNELGVSNSDTAKSPQKSLVPPTYLSHNLSLLPPNSKVELEPVCSLTDYPPTCNASLSPISPASITDYATAAINATLQEAAAAQRAFNAAADGGDNGNSSTSRAHKLCSEIMGLAVDDLNLSLSILASGNLTTASSDSYFSVMNRLSAAVAYQSACRDTLRMYGRRGKVRIRFGKPIKMTSNALAIISSTFNQSTQPRSPDKNPVGVAATLPRPDAVVAADGSGGFKTISEALSAYKLNELGRYVIYVKAGEYNESVTVEKDWVNVYMYGDGPDRTVVFGSKSTKSGLTTYETAIMAVLGDGFICRSMAIENRGKTGGATVALRVQADKSVFYNVTIGGNQAALYALAHRQFYRGCKISGSTDLVLGDAAAVIQDSEIIVNDNYGVPSYGFAAVTVQGRAERFGTTGFVLQNCTIKGVGGAKVGIVLGKPWRKGSRVVVMESYLGEGIAAEGWKVRSNIGGGDGGDLAIHEKCMYAEFGNYGPAADRSKRVRSSKEIKERAEAVQYGPSLFIEGDSWIPQAGVPYLGGLS